MADLLKLRSVFAELSSTAPRLFSAPGRVNLIGEHTDYNDGFVLPFGASLRTYIAAGLRDDGQVRISSLDLNESSIFSLDHQAYEPTATSWAKYVEGITRTLVAAGLEFGGADLAISSEVPIGAGLSSSAALEVSVGFALAELAKFKIDPLDLALAAQDGEHVYVGTNSGLMDQLTAVFAKKNHAMLIDCRSNEVTQIPMNLGKASVVVCNTNVKHALVSSAYNQRRRECENAVRLLREKRPHLQSLRDLDISELELLEELPEPERKRARHVVTENDRTLQSAGALRGSDVARLGQLMVQSHESLRDDYEVSCHELDVMFELARNHEGVSGARMMGGGFGGCTVNLVKDDHLESFIASISDGYQRRTGLAPAIYIIHADEGVRELVS